MNSPFSSLAPIPLSPSISQEPGGETLSPPSPIDALPTCSDELARCPAVPPDEGQPRAQNTSGAAISAWTVGRFVWPLLVVLSLSAACDDGEAVIARTGSADAGTPGTDAGGSQGEDAGDWESVLTEGVSEILTIDDFDDGDITNQAGGTWLAFDDGYDNGDSEVTPVSVFRGGVFAPSAPGYGGKGYAAHVTGTTGSKLGWDYLGWLASLDKDSLCPLAAPTQLDMNAYDGIQFMAKGRISKGKLVFKIPHKKSGPEDNCLAHDPVAADTLTGWADYEYDFAGALTEQWSLVRVPFDRMAQVDWAPQSAIVKLEDVLSTAQELVWQVNASGAEADVWIDNIALFKYSPQPQDAYPKTVVGGLDDLSLYDSPDDLATGTMTDVAVTGQPFTTARQIATDAEPRMLWDVMLSATNQSPVREGDLLHADFFARCAEPPAGEEPCRMTLTFQLNEDPYTRSTVYPVRVGEAWQRFSHPFFASSAYSTGEAAAILMLGYPAQTVEVADFVVRNYGDTRTEGELEKTEFTYAGREPDAPWRRAAAERIEAHRKGDLAIRVTDATGAPVTDAEVSVEMTRHRFGFGTAVDTDGLRRSFSQADRTAYTSAISRLFNTVVFENTLKWPALAGDWGSDLGMDTALWGLGWAEDLGLATRGHNLVWPGWANLPMGLKSDYDAAVAREGLDAANALLKRTVEDHVRSTVDALAGRLTHWDVLNEPFDNHDLMDILGPEVMGDWFRIARHADPSAKLFINDYSIIAPVTTYSASRSHLINVVGDLIRAGAPIDGIGLQGHFQGDLTDPERVYEILESISTFQREIWITEFDFTDVSPDLAADYTRDLLTVFFSHPSAFGFVMWGFWDGAHFGGPAPVYDVDWNEKPSGAVFRDLVFNQWWTSDSGKTDAEGRFATRGFFGDYTLTVTAGDRHRTEAIHFSSDSEETTVVLD